MAHSRLSSARLRARRTRSPLSPSGDMDSRWLDIGGAELRLRGDGGDVVWTTSLPDPAQALSRHEFAAGELPSAGADDENEEVTLERF